MPRIRTIKPQFWFDEELATVSRDTRLLYIGLWNLCDDYGVFEWRPVKIKAQLFPYDSDINTTDISKWLNDLKELGNVQFFENHNSKAYGYIPTFQEHQLIKKPSQWRYPPPPPVQSQPIITGDNTQSKKSKGSKEKYGEFQNILLTLEEYQKLIAQFGEVETLNKIETLSQGVESKGYKYKSHYATILKWNNNTKGGNIGTNKESTTTSQSLKDSLDKPFY